MISAGGCCSMYSIIRFISRMLSQPRPLWMFQLRILIVKNQCLTDRRFHAYRIRRHCHVSCATLSQDGVCFPEWCQLPRVVASTNNMPGKIVQQNCLKMYSGSSRPFTFCADLVSQYKVWRSDCYWDFRFQAGFSGLTARSRYSFIRRGCGYEHRITNEQW